MRKSSHVQFDLQSHLVWTTKYRYRVLTGKVAERVRELIRQTCNTMDVTIIRGSVGKEHIHLLISYPPSMSISKIVQYLKGKTSRVLLSEYKDLKKDIGGNICGQLDTL